MKQVFNLLLCMFIFGNFAFSQCSTAFSKNIKHGNMHSLATKSQFLVTRSDFDYSIQFQNSEDGITAIISTTAHVASLIRPLEKDDKVMFISSSGVKKTYNFISDGEKTTIKNRAAYVNMLQLNMDELKWLANNVISQIRLVIMVEKKMYPYSLGGTRQVELKNTLKCFLGELDPTKVKDREVVSGLPTMSSTPDKKNNSG